jgi:arylsulfatase A-like enzyme
MGYDAVRTERYKYIRYRDLKDMNELYDLQEDPFEVSNLIANPTAAPVRKVMEIELDRILTSARVAMPSAL